MQMCVWRRKTSTHYIKIVTVLDLSADCKSPKGHCRSALNRAGRVPTSPKKFSLSKWLLSPLLATYHMQLAPDCNSTQKISYTIYGIEVQR